MGYGIYFSIKPTSDDTGRLLWHALGAQTTKLIYDATVVDGISHEMEEMVLDANVIDNLMNNKDPKEAQRIMKILISRLTRHGDNPIFIALSQRLEALRARAEQGLISSIEFIKHLCEIARETVQAEKQSDTAQEQKSAKAALNPVYPRNEDRPNARSC